MTRPTSFSPVTSGGANPVSRRRTQTKGLIPVVIGGTITIAFAATVVISAFYLPYDPNAVNPSDRLLGPGSDGHLLGTDVIGRDVLSQLMAGARTSLLVGALGSLAGLGVGCLAGLFAASRRGLLDEAIMRGADVLLAIPGLVFALVLAAALGGGIVPTVIALMVFFAPSFTRVIRASTLGVLEEDFVTAARLYGRGKPFIVLRHVLPNISSVLIVQFTLYFALGILIEAGLSYLGVGVQRPSLSWGMMLKEAQDQVGVSGVLALWPGLTIAVVVLGLNLLGDGLRDLLDPRTARRER